MTPRSSKRVGAIALAVLLVAVGLVCWKWSETSVTSDLVRTSSHTVAEKPVARASVSGSVASPTDADGRAELVGERILQGYASPASTPENDLTLMAHLMDNFTLLVKGATDRPLSANEDWASAFRGVNPARERFLPDQHVALNPKGQLVDLWGTPLNFHALGGRRYEIRSAGPDRKLWTDDDIHRNSDGSFRKGTSLLVGDLLDAAADRKGRCPVAADIRRRIHDGQLTRSLSASSPRRLRPSSKVAPPGHSPTVSP